MSRPAATPLERLLREPARFCLDQAVAVLAPGRDPLQLSFRTVAQLGAPAGEVLRADPRTMEIVSPTFGLIGPGGVLPRSYSALVDGENRRRSTALHGFLDLLARRFTGLFVKAGAKHRPTRDPVPVQRGLAAAIGLGTPGLAERLASPLEAMLFHAGTLSSRSRSAERLRGMLCEETGADIRIAEFEGGWIRLPETEQSRMGGPATRRNARLGVDALAGAQMWDPSAYFLVRLGPLSLEAFEALLPGRPLHTRIVELTRLHVGLEQDFALNPVLAAAQVPPLQASGRACLGQTSWLTNTRPRRTDAHEAILRPVASDSRNPAP